ncbi:MAG TPA: SPOR domain-containing protein, partial [Burkholderiales bacterium]|nr:SPOR domain-containing protein [Burkholderiales bacterium]
YKVYAARTANKDEAIATYNRLTDAGYAAAIQPAFYQGKQIYQVRIMGFLSEADGVAVAVKLRVELGLQDVHVSL